MVLIVELSVVIFKMNTNGQMVKWYNQNCTMGITRDSGEHSYDFVIKKIFKHYNGSNYWPFLGFPDFGTIYWISKIQSSSYISEILRTGRKFLFIGGLFDNPRKIFLKWMSTCYLIDIVHWLHLITPFLFINDIFTIY